MTMTTIADALKTHPGTLLDGVRGVIKTVSEYNTGTHQMSDGPRKWSLQTIIIQGKNGEEIPVQIANKDKVEQEQVGRFIWLLAHQKERGGKSGLKVEQEDGQTVLRVSNSAEIAFTAPGTPVPQPLPPSVVETVQPSSTPQVGAAGLGGSQSWTSPLETEGGAKEKSAPMASAEKQFTRDGAGVSAQPAQRTAEQSAVMPPASFKYPPAVETLSGEQLLAIDNKVFLYKKIRQRVVMGIGEQLPDQDCVDRATKTIFDSMILSGPF